MLEVYPRMCGGRLENPLEQMTKIQTLISLSLAVQHKTLQSPKDLFGHNPNRVCVPPGGQRTLDSSSLAYTDITIHESSQAKPSHLYNNSIIKMAAVCNGRNVMDSQVGTQNAIVDRLKLLHPMVNEDETPLPRSWSPKDKYNYIGLSQNNLRVHYKGHGKTHKDAASVRATHAIPAACGLYYFEVKIVSKGRDGYMGIGLSAQGVNMNRLPGWDKHSYGYHGDDGHSFCSSGTGQPYGPTFTTGDVIGCGVNLIDNTCFYTKNGHNLGVAFTDLPPNLYPTVGLQTPGEVVDANFGQAPFVFDIEDMMRELRARTQATIHQYPVPDNQGEWQATLHNSGRHVVVHHGKPNLYPTVGLQTPGEVVDANFGQAPFVFDIEDMMRELRARTQATIHQYPVPDNQGEWQATLHKMVSTYLVHHGYCATAESFAQVTGQVFDEDVISIKNRQRILKLVLAGRMGEAIETTGKLYPGLLERNQNLLFLLKCRQFVEMVNGSDTEVCPPRCPRGQGLFSPLHPSSLSRPASPAVQTSVIQSTKALYGGSNRNNSSVEENNLNNTAINGGGEPHCPLIGEESDVEMDEMNGHLAPSKLATFPATNGYQNGNSHQPLKEDLDDVEDMGKTYLRISGGKHLLIIFVMNKMIEY
uniref:(California timema) hypothetical protein n=1 Tax=Timema californicum TaxID=61474 RepID=A0A7R9IX77_TIMCA|nr:unnamed protein product [Timema californicum]